MTTPTQQAFRFTTPSPDARPSRSNLVIEAGAGTGKTSAIVAEVLKLLLENEELSPERIVLMTFTEKAAGEIADRIHQAMAELELHFDDERVVWPAGSPNPLFVVPPERMESYRSACRRQIGRIDGLRSQTIHSFCQSLLRAYPIEAALDPQFKIVEGFERSLLYAQLYDRWLDEETRIHPTEQTLREWEFLLAHVGYLFQIRELVFSLLDRRDLLSESGPDFGDFEDIETDLRNALTTIRRSDISRVGDVAAKTVFRYVKESEAPQDASLDAWIGYFEPIVEAICHANLAGERDLKEALVVLRTDRAKTDTCIYHRLVRHRSAVAIQSLTCRFIDFLDREKHLLGVVDFDDLLLRTVDLLDDASVLERVRAQFDYIFVDEFQDTDRTQARIIERLSRDRTGGWTPGKTIVVGDPKQSIYGFRRADPETYRGMSDKLIRAGAEHRIIRDQYRSDPPLLEAINAMFDAVFTNGGGSNANVFRPAYHELKAGKPSCDRELDSRLTFLRAETSEAEAIAEWITRNRDGSDRDLQRFAILFRRLTRIDDYLDVFDRHGIDYVLPPTKAFLERRAPVDLMAVLRAIAFPFDRGAEISAARTPSFALTDDEIADGAIGEEAEAGSSLSGAPLSSAAPAPVGTPAPHRETAWVAFREVLETYRNESRHLTVSGTIDLLVRSARIEEIYALSSDGHRAARHLERLRALAFEYDQKIGGSIRQFVEEIDRRREEPDDMEPSLADDDSNAIRILSVHAAKGLEFETVILPDLSFRTKGSGEGLQLFAVEEPPSLVMTGRAQSLSAHYRFASDGGRTRLKQILGAREEAEVRRLFYVAVTRAKTDVVFVCNTGSFRNDGFFRCLSETFGFEKDSFASLWAEEGRHLRELKANGRIVRAAFERPSAGEGAGAPPAFRRLADVDLERTLAEGPIVPLELASPPPSDTFDRAAAAIARHRSRGRAGGLLLHRFLELWDGTSETEGLLRKLSIEAASSEETLAAVRRRVNTIRSSPVVHRIAAAETIGRELPIRILEGGELIERRIDRLIRENGRDLVIDYKSGKPDAERLPRDREQVEQYCRAVASISGRDCEGLLWYIDLDSDVTVEVAGVSGEG